MYKPISIKRSDEYFSNYWEGYSQKLNREVNFFGDLRYEYWLLVETNPAVITFCERPLIIEEEVNGKKVKTYIDMWVKWSDERETYVKVVYSNKTEIPIRNIERIWCNSQGFEYVIVTDVDIRTNDVQLLNSKHLITNITGKNASEIDIAKIKKYLSIEKTTLKDILTHFNDSMTIERCKEAIFWMIYKGIICSDINKRLLSLETEVWIDGQTKNN